MLSQLTKTTAFRRSALRLLSTEAAAPATSVNLRFSLPHETVYYDQSVSQVILPGIEGDYGVTANHVPYVAQLKPGLMQIVHAENDDPEKYFISGGYAFTHQDSTTVRVSEFDRIPSFLRV